MTTIQQRQRMRKHRKRDARHVRRMSPEMVEERLALSYEREFLEHERRRRREEYLAWWPLTSSWSKTVTGRLSSSKPNLQRLPLRGAVKSSPFQALAYFYMNSGVMGLRDFKAVTVRDTPIILAPPRSGKTMLMSQMLEYSAKVDQMVYYDLESSSRSFELWFKMRKNRSVPNVACASYVAHEQCKATAKLIGRCEQA